MKDDFYFVSVIVPCRNEGNFISKCFDTIINQDFPKEKLEVLVINGASEDKTKEIIKGFLTKYPFIRLLENPKKFTPFALNIGIKNAKGDIIVRMDVHASYEKDYISKCVRYLQEYGADNVGGIIKTLPQKDIPVASAIAICLSTVFGALSFFRLSPTKPREVDTVFGGCYKREVFDRIGLFNEKLQRSQDMEFNIRLKKAGGKIMLIPDIVSYYYPSATFKDFLKHNFNDGIWVTYPLKFGVRIFKLRHLIPLFFVLFLMLTLILNHFFIARFLFVLSFGGYLFLNIFFSFTIALQRGLRYFFLMPIAFICRHFGYGLGSILGAIKILTD